MTEKRKVGRPRTGINPRLRASIKPELMEKLKAKSRAEDKTVTKLTEEALEGLFGNMFPRSFSPEEARQLLKQLPSPDDVARNPKGSLIVFNKERREVLVMPRKEIHELRAWLEGRALPNGKKSLELVGR